jgi:hypothetical protein
MHRRVQLLLASITPIESNRYGTNTEPFTVAILERHFLRPNTTQAIAGSPFAACQLRRQVLILSTVTLLSGFNYLSPFDIEKAYLSAFGTVAPYLTHLMQENVLLASNIILRSRSWPPIKALSMSTRKMIITTNF